MPKSKSTKKTKPKVNPIKVDTSPIIASKTGSSFIPRKTTYLILILAVIAVVLGYFRLRPQPTFSSYDECAADKKSIIRETYPPICVTYTGQEFTAIVPTTTPIPTPTPVSTAPQGWQTAKYNSFSIYFPPDWTASPPATSSATTSYTFQTSTATDSGTLTFNISHTDWTGSLNEFIGTEYQNYQSIYGTNATWEDATGRLDGQTATLIENQTDYYSIYALHPEANLVFHLELSKNFDDAGTLSTDIYETFEFISPPPANTEDSTASPSATL